jgi:Predicted integral membrane protein (DUF2269)
MLQLLLVLHVLGAIAVFGPISALTLIARDAGRDPQHRPFAAAITDAIERRVVIPGAIVQGITGLGLIVALSADLMALTYRWLVGGIVLYVLAVGYAIVVQAPAAAKLVRLTADDLPASVPSDGASRQGAPADPNPEITATARMVDRGGMFLASLIVVIVILMVAKPGL